MINIYNFSFALFYFILFFSRDNFRYFLIIILGNVFFYEIYVIRCVVPDLRKYEIRNGSIFQRWKETRDLHSAIFQQRSMKKIEGIYYVIWPFFDNE